MDPNVEKRTSERRDALLPVDYYVDRNRLHKHHLSVNISEGGIFIRTKNPLKVGDELDVIVSLFNQKEPESPPRRVAIHGQVRHIRRARGDVYDPLAGMGVQWLDLDGSTWNEIEGTVLGRDESAAERSAEALREMRALTRLSPPTQAEH
ncbi:PilZ domain-containing protein [bacterium]|nr:PilZ domain-containing protein [bacterium]